MAGIRLLKKAYPWIKTPLVVGAPMRLISLADMAVEISKAGGIGFLGGGTDVSDLDSHFQSAQRLLSGSPLPTHSNTLPIGVGFINWGANLAHSLPLIAKYKPAAVWFFAAPTLQNLQEWTEKSREASPETQVWVQVGSVSDALEALSARPDVIVVQGSDAGGHGLVKGAGIITLFPEVEDAIRAQVKKEGREPPVLIAAGGISEARSAAAALALGAGGVVMGTRFLASKEAVINPAYQADVLRTTDGGQTTVRTKLYDTLRGTTGWQDHWDGRGLINKSYTDAVEGLGEEENKKLYRESEKKGEAGWGPEGRMTAYAGSGVGLVREVKGSGAIVQEIQDGVKGVL
ncbi:inosine monophosphate dehydrogenase, partial [Amniculicola lignicola CBS 123094]